MILLQNEQFVEAMNVKAVAYVINQNKSKKKHKFNIESNLKQKS